MTASQPRRVQEAQRATAAAWLRAGDMRRHQRQRRQQVVDAPADLIEPRGARAAD